MASKALNPSAPEFVPSSYKSDSPISNWASIEEDCSEDHITPEELEELELAEEWVAAMAEIGELEEDHLVAVALRYAPESKVNEIRRRCGIKPSKMRSHKGIRSQAGMARAW